MCALLFELKPPLRFDNSNEGGGCGGDGGVDDADVKGFSIMGLRLGFHS